MEKKIRELSITNALTDAYLLLAEVKELKRSLSLELDLVLDRRQAQEKEFRQFLTELWEFLDKLAAKYCVDSQLLNLVREPRDGDQERRQKRIKAQTRGIPHHGP